MDRMKRDIEVEIGQLQAQFEEAESAVECEENKIVRAQMELNQIKSEVLIFIYDITNITNKYYTFG